MATWATLACEKATAERHARNHLSDVCRAKRELEQENAELKRTLKEKEDAEAKKAADEKANAERRERERQEYKSSDWTQEADFLASGDNTF